MTKLDHGGDAMASGNGDEMADHSAMSLPPQVTQQMLAVLDSVHAIEAAIEEAALKEIRSAFAALGKQVAAGEQPGADGGYGGAVG